ncbi:DUF4405 domain-containing protein [candidate division KSB1 bacterium]|nr:DUF4405 domain-containing protein [candidate division KSB1 bacterium]
MKGKINFIIDALMFLLLAAVTGLGFLMKYVLIPGKDRIVKLGRSVDLYFLGLDRHEWGTIHLILGFIMLGLLVLHVILHWKSIQGLFRCLVSRKTLRASFTALFSVICLCLMVFPFLIHIEIQKATAGRKYRSPVSSIVEFNKSKKEEVQAAGTKRRYHDKQAIQRMDIRIQGRMTLAQVSAQQGIPVSIILSGLGINDPVSRQIRIGHLRKRCGFHMSDVIHIIQRYKASHSK